MRPPRLDQLVGSGPVQASGLQDYPRQQKHAEDKSPFCDISRPTIQPASQALGRKGAHALT